MNLTIKNHLEGILFKQNEKQLHFNWQNVGGGSINNTYKLCVSDQCFFIKTNTVNIFKNGYSEEVNGLEFLKSHGAITPQVIASGNLNNHIYLVLEWVHSARQTEKFWKNFAEQLTNLHRCTSDSFGLDHTNFMGQLEQKNSYYSSFSEFFIACRLKPQLKLAYNKGLIDKRQKDKFENLFNILENILPIEPPAAVHGDLWSGNFICNTDENAVFIDPAVYYGHREIDVSMSMLFGGFSSIFYEEYQEIYPMNPGFNERKDIYNLYPLLIHLNLFGTSYKSSILRIIDRF